MTLLIKKYSFQDCQKNNYALDRNSAPPISSLWGFKIPLPIPLVAFIGASVTACIIYLFSYSRITGLQPVRLVLMGVGYSSALSGTMIVLISAADYLLLTAVALAASAVSVTGGIAFIGLMAPHLAKTLVGPRNQSFIPVAILMGGWMLLLADTAGRQKKELIILCRIIPIGVRRLFVPLA